MFGSYVKIKIEKSLYEKLARRAKEGGYSDTDEYLNHVLERDAGKSDSQNTESQIEKQLRGLGYIE